MNISQSFLLLLTLFIINVFCYKTEYNLDAAKKLKVDTCKSDKDCKKDFQTKCLIPNGKKEGHCISTLYCPDGNDKCIFEEKKDNDKGDSVVVNYEPVSHYSFFINTGGQKPTLIIESCHKDRTILENCYTRECEKDEQCFSGTCHNNVCITNEKKPLYICSNDRSVFQDLDEDEDFDTNTLTCKLAEEEICKKNSDCATGSCQKRGSASICVISSHDNLKFVAGILVLILFILIVYISCKECVKNYYYKKAKRELRIKYEMEEAFLNHSNRDYVELVEEDENINEPERKFRNYNSFN